MFQCKGIAIKKTYKPLEELYRALCVFGVTECFLLPVCCKLLLFNN